MPDQDPKIELLTENNFESWFVNIRAKLRKEKLWEYTQTTCISESTSTSTTEGEQSSTSVTKKEQEAVKEWAEKSQESADIMTLTISPGVQQKLTEVEFNDGYLMLTRLRTLLQPTGPSEFMRLSKEYYTLRFKAFKTVSEYLNRIKILEEKIDASKVILDANNRTILCLSMSLPQEYQYLVQIWAVTPGITAEKAREMVLEASRQHQQARHDTNDPGVRASRAQGKEACKNIKSSRHPSNSCYFRSPHLAPEWFKYKMNEEAKEKGRRSDRARRFQAKLATHGGNKDDDLQVKSATHDRGKGDDDIPDGPHISP